MLSRQLWLLRNLWEHSSDSWNLTVQVFMKKLKVFVSQPINGGPPGHNLNDHLVPVFPLRKNADFYKESKEPMLSASVIPVLAVRNIVSDSSTLHVFTCG